jgi:hypothetical protein
MLATRPLIDRIRGEYREMPGLRLTIAQARRLWQLDHDACVEALDTLVREGFLGVTLDHAYVALPFTSRAQLRPLRATLESVPVRRHA